MQLDVVDFMIQQPPHSNNQDREVGASVRRVPVISNNVLDITHVRFYPFYLIKSGRIEWLLTRIST